MKRPLNYNNGFSSFSIIIVFAALMIMGVSFLSFLKIKLNPSRSLPSMEVSFSWPDASARIIEQEVTSRLEGLFSSIKGIKDVSSVSSKGLGKIKLSFKENTKLDVVRYEVASLIRQAYPELPLQVSYPSISIGTTGEQQEPVIKYNLIGSTNTDRLQRYAEHNIIPKLSLLEGVSEVNILGGTKNEWEIIFDSQKLNNLGISPSQVAGSINNYFGKETIGLGESCATNGNCNQRLRVILKNDIPKIPEWDIIPVKKIGNRIVYLGDVAEIKYQEQLPQNYYRINGLNTIYLIVYAESGANTLSVEKEVSACIESIMEDLPSSFSILLTYDSTKQIAKDIGKIGLRALYSVLILLFFLFIITTEWRYLFLIIVTILSNLIISVVFYYLFKIEIHLYSLAGISVSIGVIINNSIVMIEHHRHKRERNVFLSILAATLTTIGSVVVIFFLEESIRINLLDFAWVIIINLSVSLVVALFLIPSLMEKLPLKRKVKKFLYKRKRKIILFNYHYEKSILFIKQWKLAFVFLLILGFGIPVHWLPEEWDGNNRWIRWYNQLFDEEWVSETVKPRLEEMLGGSLRLFSENIVDKPISDTKPLQRTALIVRGKMSDGGTVEQLNFVIQKLENFISQYKEIETFQTSVSNPKNSIIVIFFKPEIENGLFPHQFKEVLIDKAKNLGGLDWTIGGIGMGFSNELHIGYNRAGIALEGYDYERLYFYGELLRENLLRNDRVRNAIIEAEESVSNNPLQNYHLKFDQEFFALHDITLSGFYNYLNEQLYLGSINSVFDGSEAVPVKFVSSNFENYDHWWIKNDAVNINGKMSKLHSVGNLEKRNTDHSINRFNQQYRLQVVMDFEGESRLAGKLVKNTIKELTEILPLGYVAGGGAGEYVQQDDSKKYYLILLVIVIIYFICGILLESLLQPLAVITLIPISFIGVFLTFYLFEFNFDQGGYASFLLLAGLAVNSGLYVINDYNNLSKRKSSLSAVRLYIKAFNHKIIPIFLTILSTILSLVPFIWEGQKEFFWFSFAVGTIGGLLFSVIALIVYFPMFLRMGQKNKIKNIHPMLIELKVKKLLFKNYIPFVRYINKRNID